MSETILGGILANSFSGLLGNLATKYVERRARSITVAKEDLQFWLNPSLEATFNKCMKVKTLLNSSNPSSFLNIYVNQNFKNGHKTVDGYDLIDEIRSGQNSIIVGTGGGGKSMFMRYLWLSLFERADGKIPFLLN